MLFTGELPLPLLPAGVLSSVRSRNRDLRSLTETVSSCLQPLSTARLLSRSLFAMLSIASMLSPTSMLSMSRHRSTAVNTGTLHPTPTSLLSGTTATLFANLHTGTTTLCTSVQSLSRGAALRAL